MRRSFRNCTVIMMAAGTLLGLAAAFNRVEVASSVSASTREDPAAAGGAPSRSG